MAEVFKLGIAANNNQPIKEVKSIEVLANKGIVGDRHFHDFNDPYNQLSLIESENIDEYNIKFGLDIPYINFRRNIITKHGAVSYETCLSMVKNLSLMSKTHVSVSITGVAGPGGGTKSKPVGLVYIGVKKGKKIE